MEGEFAIEEVATSFLVMDIFLVRIRNRLVKETLYNNNWNPVLNDRVKWHEGISSYPFKNRT